MMTLMKIIPAIDLIDGECVRLQQGDFKLKSVYSSDPISVAKTFQAAGSDLLHIVDLDGAALGRPVQLPIIGAIMKETGLDVQTGGGYQSSESVKSALNLGVTSVIIGSMAVKQPELFISLLKEYGGDSIILSADVLQGIVMVNGWKNSGSVAISHLIDSFLQHGLKKVVVTDISKDGMLTGPSIDLYLALMNLHPDIQIVASGGVSSMKDIFALENAGLNSVIVGKALYEGKITIDELSKYRSDYVG